SDDPRVECVAASPDGRHLASLQVNGICRVWDAATERMRGQFMTWTGQGRLLAFSPDGQWLATLGADQVIHLREPLSGESVLALRGHEGRVVSLAFGYDGRTLLSGSDDCTALLWSLRPEPAADRDLADLWNDLGGADAPAAYRAIWGF